MQDGIGLLPRLGDSKAEVFLTVGPSPLLATRSDRDYGLLNNN